MDRHGLHLYTVLADEDKIDLDRDGWLAALHRMNIGSGVHYLGIFEQIYYQTHYGWSPAQFPSARFVSERPFSLPLSAKLADDEVSFVIKII